VKAKSQGLDPSCLPIVSIIIIIINNLLKIKVATENEMHQDTEQ